MMTDSTYNMNHSTYNPEEAYFNMDFQDDGIIFSTQFTEGAVSGDHADLYNRDKADQHPIGAITGLQDVLDSKLDDADVGVANGVAPLDENIKIPLGYIPLDSTIDETSENPLSNSGVYSALSAVVEELRLEMPKIEFGTQSYWNSQTRLIGVENTIYVYTDCIQYDNYNLARVKIGDGSSYLIDMPFMDMPYYNHINDGSIHVTPEEKAFWNNKVTCYISLTDEETIVFTKD